MQAQQGDAQWLLFDAGNTRIKVALWQPSQSPQATQYLSAETIDAAAWPWLSMGDELAGGILLAGSQKLGDECAQAWSNSAGARPLYRLGADMPLPDLGQYATCGYDRICAGLAAVQEIGQGSTNGGVIVVDAGTATTISAWAVVPPADGDQRVGARLLGGLILPGALACAAGLTARAPALPVIKQLPLRSDLPSPQSLARDTTGAITRALAIGYPAMLKACVEAVQQDSGLSSVMLSGGAGQTLREELPAQWLWRPQLTLCGLALLAEEFFRKLPNK